MYIISACLLGENCKYSGGNNYTSWVSDFVKEHNYISICPEVYGNLSIPRLPAEINGDRIINKEGIDVTENFIKGAEIALKKAEEAAEHFKEPIEGAILKSRSPSCGCGKIYDGTFSGNLINGDGMFVKLLKEHVIRVFTEKDRL